MAQTVDVPRRGQKWRNGAFLRDGQELYRVAGAPVRYHEDCLPSQKVTRVRTPPEDWTRTLRLLEIMDHVKQHGTHTPHSRGASGDRSVAPLPAPAASTARWQATQDATSYASFPSIEARSDGVIVYCEPIYDDAPIVTWVTDPDLAFEASEIIAKGASLVKYPRVHVRKV